MMGKIKLFVAAVMMSVSTFGQTTSEAQAFQTSYQLEQYQNYSAAITALKAAYREDSYAFNVRLGWLYYLSGDYISSVNYYDKAIALEQNSIEARLGKAYPVLALNNMTGLMELYKEILKIDPNHAVANYRLAYLYYNSKKYKEAEGHLALVRMLQPFDYDTLVLLAKVKVSLGQISEAKELYNQALLYNPSATEVLEALKKLG